MNNTIQLFLTTILCCHKKPEVNEFATALLAISRLYSIETINKRITQVLDSFRIDREKLLVFIIRFCFFNANFKAIHLEAIQSFDGGLGFSRFGHLNKPKPLGMASFFIHHQRAGLNCTMFFKHGFKLGFGHVAG